MKTSVLCPAAAFSAVVLSHFIGNPVRAGDCPSFNFIAVGQFATGTAPVSVAVGQFNGDANLDLVVVNQQSADVSVLLGNANGTFQAATNYAAGTAPRSVALGDFNGDMETDLAVADSGGSVWVFLGLGNGAFQTATNLLMGDAPSAVTVGDFNGDNKADLAVADRALANVSVLLGTGTGTFQFATNYDAGIDPVAVVTGNFNGDSRTDLAVANAALFDVPPSVSVLLGAGGGNFSNAVNYAAGASPRSVAVGDFNGDSRPDLAVASYGSGTNGGVSVLLGNANGTFQAATNYSAGAGPVAVAAADFDGDGKLDLAVANNLAGSVSVLLGNGNGSFQAPLDYDVGPGPTAVAIDDFNGDDKPDLVVANSSGVRVLIQIENDAVLVGLPVLNLSVQCLDDVPPVPTVTACDTNVTVTFSSSELGGPCNRTIMRTWTATDPSSNTVSYTQTITIHDDTAPTLSRGTLAFTYATIPEAEAAALAATGASDNCSAVTKTVSTVGDCTNAVVTVTGTDACGNQRSVSYTPHIDAVPPVLNGLPAAPTLNVQCLADVPPPPAVTATDNCEGNLPVLFATNQTGTACNRTITRTWSAMDSSSNAVSFTQTITVQDTTSPLLMKGTIASNYLSVAAAEAAALAATTATDNCGAVTKTASTVGTCSATITVTGMDMCGNEQSVTYSTRIDNAPPVFNGLPPATLELQCLADVPAPPTVTATDNCAGVVPVTYTTNETGTACNRTITRTWSASDASSNTVSFTQTITVIDVGPTLTKGTIASGYQTVAEAEAAALAATEATDHCGPVTETVSTTGTCNATVTVTGTDICGNQQSVSYNTSINSTPPVLNGLPTSGLVLECLADVPAPPTVTATDDCAGTVPVTYTTNQTGTACNRIFSRTWSAMDVSGNTASFTQTISVVDDISPTVTKGTIASNYVTVVDAETAALAATTASDNCDVTKTASTMGECPATITVTATDACGHQDSVTYTTCISAASVSLAIVRNGANVTISWPMPSTGFVLESAMSLSSPSWQTVSETPVANNGRWEVTISIGPQNRYFRLHKP